MFKNTAAPPPSAASSAAVLPPPAYSEQMPQHSETAVLLPGNAILPLQSHQMPALVQAARSPRRNGFDSCCWNLTRGCGYYMLYCISAAFFLVLFWVVLPWTGKSGTTTMPGDRQIIQFDTRYLKEVKFALTGSQTTAYLVDEVPALTESFEYKAFKADFSWLSAMTSSQTLDSFMTPTPMMFKSKFAQNADNKIMFEFYSLHKGGKVKVDYVLPEELCGDSAEFPVRFFFSNVLTLEFASITLYPDLNNDLGCKGSIEVEAKDYGKHIVGFMASPKSIQSLSDSMIRITARTPTLALPSAPIKTCTFGASCDLTFSSLGITSRYARLMIVDTQTPRPVVTLDGLTYNVVGKWYIYGPLRLISWVLTLGLLVFSFTTCCCGVSPVDAVRKMRGRRVTFTRGGLIVSYQAVPSGP
ncbi:hypothetical protein HDU67_002480 [Dinochytrium kinnereticum]|nr:hypothetical protein HDU67_002480 [Dinochytrium kinnereticum]